jgi:hypothetical protein
MSVLHNFLQTPTTARILIHLQHDYYTYVSISIQNASKKTVEKIEAHLIIRTQNGSLSSRDTNTLTR